MGKINLKPIMRKPCAPAFGPFNSENSAAVYVVTQARILELGGSEAV
ncbi:MAG TPA: hypothetical protein PKI24_04400 [Nitrospira sp.]|nr:hypothetical protein [Nitrospira sp.]HMW87941.1 hypothetical protein [Nitrospira sp.]HMZ96694.1 hypothetical protein [Nitrospira sp.]HNE31966.1 hypothetical protein [Nitrospira sp.]HNM17274.1 hypothetical protein [Nitrospira sp.]